MLFLWLGTPGVGGGGGESLAAGDLTTAFSKWLATKGHPKNEAVRAALNTHYSTSYADIQPPVARFLKDRS
jgi:hypothetical protein